MQKTTVAEAALKTGKQVLSFIPKGREQKNSQPAKPAEAGGRARTLQSLSTQLDKNLCRSFGAPACRVFPDDCRPVTFCPHIWMFASPRRERRRKNCGRAAAMAQDFSFMTHTAPLWRTGGPQAAGGEDASKALRQHCRLAWHSEVPPRQNGQGGQFAAGGTTRPLRLLEVDLS